MITNILCDCILQCIINIYYIHPTVQYSSLHYIQNDNEYIYIYMIFHCVMSVKMLKVPSTQIHQSPITRSKNARTSSSDKLRSFFAENIMVQEGNDNKHTHTTPGHHPQEGQGAIMDLFYLSNKIHQSQIQNLQAKFS